MTNPIVTGESQKGKYNHFVSLSAYKTCWQHWHSHGPPGGPVEWRGLVLVASASLYASTFCFSVH
jgi:hypothetical protein